MPSKRKRERDELGTDNHGMTSTRSDSDESVDPVGARLRPTFK
jgi:hypothetical protein